MKMKMFGTVCVVTMMLTACTPADIKRHEAAPAAPMAAPTEQAPSQMVPDQTEAPSGDQPLTSPSLAGCEVVLTMTERAIEAGTVALDQAAVHGAWAKYQAQFEAGFSADERAQFVASTQPFYDELTPDQLKASAEVCMTAQDQTFDPANG